MSFPRYPKYKDSGVEWLGEVPEHWKMVLLKRAFASVDYGISDALDSEGAVAILRMGNIENGRVVMDDLKYADVVPPTLLLRHGDLLYNRTNSLDLIGKVGMFVPPNSDPVSFASYLVRMRTAADSVPEFFAYFLNTDGILSVARSNAFVAIGQCNLNPTRYGQIEIALPPKTEQIAIAEFLDREIGKVDELVVEQRRLMELLKEKRQAVISQAVTKGLNPRVPMKPSGIEWLGDVPEHWRMLRLKHVSPRISGRLVYQPAQYFSNEGVPFLMGNNVTEQGISWDDVKLIPEDINKSFAEYALREGDVVTVRVGAPGVTCVVPKEADGLNCGSLMIIRRSPTFSSDWLSVVMNSVVVRTQIDEVQYGAAQEQINITDAVNFQIPTPPLSEQHEIAAFLMAEIGKFDALAAEAQKAIDLLQERRTALISAAVTGQIDVRKLAAA
jgi:type I restriction enzyme, S subunit